MERQEALSRFSGNAVRLSNSDYLVYRPLIELLTANIARHATGKVLDIGCGNKPYLDLFPKSVSEYVGCDIVQSDLNRVDIICEANNIPLESNSMDTVFSTQVIEHVADHNGLLSEANRILKPGGKIIVSGPMYWQLHEEPHDYFRFTRYGFSYLLKKHGFKEIAIQPCGGKWALTGIVLLYAIPGRPRIINRILNPIFSWMDRKFPDYGNTTNYVVVGEKI